MTIQGYDGLSHPSPAAVGKGHWVGCYLKDTTPATVAAYHAAGVAVVLLYETTGKRSLLGHGYGALDGMTALQQARALGAPPSAAIYFAEDDFDVSAAQAPVVVDYMRGVHSILAGRTGFYGGFRAVKAVLDAGVAAYGFQTYGWSGGKWDQRAVLEQYLNGQTLAGTGVDLDRALAANYGGWLPPAPVTPPTPPAHAPQPPSEDDMLARIFQYTLPGHVDADYITWVGLEAGDIVPCISWVQNRDVRNTLTLMGVPRVPWTAAEAAEVFKGATFVGPYPPAA